MSDPTKGDPALTPTAVAVTGPTAAGTAPPLRAAGYQLGEVIGRGGMGEVLLAHDQRMGRDVAIKRMLVAAPTADETARFLREAQIQARLDHPAIVPVHDLDEDAEGRPYFTMKRLTGVTLATTIENPDAQLQRLLRAFVDVCLAIELAHTRRIVHRDLKPSNIMLGDFGEVYVLDWGVARVIGDADAAGGPAIATLDGKTAAGAILGTPGYMAPEQMRGAEVGPPADVYALGCILFEILAREPLHRRGRQIDSMLGEQHISPAQRCPDRGIAPELDETCVAALAVDPGSRPTARALAERLQHYLDGDRDLERRKTLAAAELVRARAALVVDDRALAMQTAGRALALDPDSRDAAAIVTSLMLEPPKVLPQELHVHLVSVDANYARGQFRSVAIAYLAFFSFLPLFLWQGVTSYPLLVGMCASVAINVVVAIANSRALRPRYEVMLVSGIIGLMLLTRYLGPFVVAPAIFGVTMSTWLTYPTMVMRPWRWIAVMMLAGIVPIVVDVTGVVGRTWNIVDGAFVATSSVVEIHPFSTTVTLIWAFVATLGISGWLAASLAASRREAHRRAEIQAWHLRKLLPT